MSQLAPQIPPSESREAILRRTIPKREDIKTDYHPCANYLMIVPLPGQDRSEGGILFPGSHQEAKLEGHIVEKGPFANPGYLVGDCVCWSKHDELRFNVDDQVKFSLVKDSAILMRIPRNSIAPLKDSPNLGDE